MGNFKSVRALVQTDCLLAREEGMDGWIKAADGDIPSFVQPFCCAQAMHLVKPFMTVTCAASFVLQASAK